MKQVKKLKLSELSKKIKRKTVERVKGWGLLQG